jgi:uncharacterized protein YbaP (TraB family)
MAARADALLQQPGVTFIAIGAAHVSGKGGVGDLLREQGFDVQRVYEK